MLHSIKPKLIFLTCIFFFLCCPALFFTGCEPAQNGSGHDADDTINLPHTEKATSPEDQLYSFAEKAARTCKKIFPAGSGSSVSEQEIITCLGNAGYCAVDTDNRINMINYSQLKDFCGQAANGTAADATLIAVKSDKGLVCYKFHSDGEILDVERCSADWTGDDIKVDFYETFTAVRWEYTEKGYFLFEQYREPGYDGPPGEFGFRVEPLDDSLRAINEQYVLPIGYTVNNMFITDWSEDTGFQSLNLYDMYTAMYEMKHREYFPCQVSFSGEVYEIPDHEFEDVLQAYLALDTDTIREKTVYHSETDTYLYRPRGMAELEMPYQPVPEVTACEERPDGSLTLTVEAVWIRKFTDQAAISELVIRPLENGGFQYVSNHVTVTVKGITGAWHTPRLPPEE